MESKELEVLVQQGESETLEFKKSTALLDSAAQTLCGFLNRKGGRVVIGVTAEGKIVGQNVSDHTLQEIARVLAKFEPHAQIDIDQVAIDPKNKVIILTVLFRRSDIPYTWDGRPYQRVASTTSRMPQSVYQKWLLERDQNNHRWETGIANGYSLEDLDSEEIFRTMRAGAEARRLPEYRGEGIGSILDRLPLRKGENLLNAAVVLFGIKFLPDFPQCELRLARFKGIDKSEFMDQKQLRGHAFYLLEEALLFLRRHLSVAAKILPDALERKEEPLFPFEALREALVNALCHRSYSNPGGAISVAIFDDRLEIWNNGKFPIDLPLEDIKKDHKSFPYNPLIAATFYAGGFIEKWGRGIQKIVRLCVEAGQPEPEFLEQSGAVVTRFFSRDYAVPSQVSYDLTDRQRLLLQLLSKSPRSGITFADVKSELQDSPADRTLRDDFQQLKRLRLIAIKGRGKNAKWSLALNSKE
jgi:ATP-dependent DNA helicase RecG